MSTVADLPPGAQLVEPIPEPDQNPLTWALAYRDVAAFRAAAFEGESPLAHPSKPGLVAASAQYRSSGPQILAVVTFAPAP